MPTFKEGGMGQDYRHSIQRLRERLTESDNISEEDAEALHQYTLEVDAVGHAEMGDAVHERNLMRLVKMAEEVGGLAASLEEKQAAKELNSWIQQHYPNPESNKTARDALHSFGKHATEDEDEPDSLSWIPTGYPQNYDRKPDPSKMYEWEDHVIPMLDACRNYRDEALIGLAFDIGPRSGELQDLQIGDLVHKDHGIQITLKGKQGKRSPTAMVVPDRINKWLQIHPADEDPTAPLWSKLNSPEPISANMIRKIFREAAKRADITPPSQPTPTRFRKSSASHLAKRNVSQTHLENRYGWVRGSDEAARYIAVYGSETDKEVARVLGIEIEEDEHSQMGPLTCPRCEQQTPRDKSSCVWCGQALSIEAAENAEAQEQRARETLASLDPEEASEVQETIELLSDPTIQSQLQSMANQD